MDTPYLDAAVQSFSRVLRPGGIAVLVFSHPCFPQTNVDELGGIIHYSWNFPYFEESKQVDPPWRHFKSDFTWYHRPLSGYWKTFKSAGFQVEDFDEPRVTEDRYHLTNDKKRLHNSQMRPYSVAFKLVKA
jgi:SAM-dependent methyltransferase